MDDEHELLEAELKRLRPIVPTAQLIGRVERELAHEAKVGAPPGSEKHPVRKAVLPRFTNVHWWWAAALPAAAAIAILLTHISRSPDPAGAVDAASPQRTVSASPDAALKPIMAENVLYSATDEGLIMLDDGTPARRERLQYVDTITWRNPRTNASLKWSVPREEVRVVPVVFQ